MIPIIEIAGTMRQNLRNLPRTGGIAELQTGG